MHLRQIRTPRDGHYSGVVSVFCNCLNSRLSGVFRLSTDEHVSGSVARVQRRSTGSHCRSLYCLPKYCLCGSSLRTSNTGSPNTHCPCLTKSPRNTEPVRPLRVRDRSLWMQELPQPPKSCVSSSFKLHAGVSNNTKDVVAISFLKHLRQSGHRAAHWSLIL